jgi:hypothetical protein
LPEDCISEDDALAAMSKWLKLLAPKVLYR